MITFYFAILSDNNYMNICLAIRAQRQNFDGRCTAEGGKICFAHTNNRYFAKEIWEKRVTLASNSSIKTAVLNKQFDKKRRLLLNKKKK